MCAYTGGTIYFEILDELPQVDHCFFFSSSSIKHIVFMATNSGLVRFGKFSLPNQSWPIEKYYIYHEAPIRLHDNSLIHHQTVTMVQVKEAFEGRLGRCWWPACVVIKKKLNGTSVLGIHIYMAALTYIATPQLLFDDIKWSVQGPREVQIRHKQSLNLDLMRRKLLRKNTWHDPTRALSIVFSTLPCGVP